MKKVTMESIAKELNISKVAVFKALNDQPGISEKLRGEVKKTAKDMGYNYVNTKLKNNLKFLFLIKKDFFLMTSEQFYTMIYYYLNIETENFNHQLSILFFDSGKDPLSSLKNRLKNEQIAGVYIAGEVETSLLEQLDKLKIPLVFIDFYSPLYDYPYIYSDNYHLSYILTQYLFKNGHSQIGFVGDRRATSSICDRFLGYRKALIENDIEYKPQWYIPYNIEQATVSHEILPQTLPTAFICHCDSAAYKLYMLLKMRNYSVPDDISVISFDNTELCNNISPTLTSIGVSKATIARKSFNAMLDLLNKKKNTYLLKPIITERQSVKKLN